MEYYKSITAFSRMQQATSAQATHQGGTKKRKRLQRKEQQGQKQAEQGQQHSKGKAMETTTKEDSARAKERYRCNRKDGNNSRLDKAIHSARAMHKHHTKATKERQR